MRPLITLAVFGAMALAENMNGEYTIANPNPNAKTQFSTVYTDEYVDVYSPPITTRYSEVFWTMMDAVPLPKELVERFNDKVMAITGFEQDQVFKTANGDVGVPITWQYNHHFEAYLHGAYSKLAVREADPTIDPHALRKRYEMTNVADDPRANSSIPAGQWFSEGNGGESRKSFHGYPAGMVQLIDSPTAFQIQPMQIDTRNRNYNGSDFRPGPLPRSAASPPNAHYSGLLECPCTTRINRTIEVQYNTLTTGTCPTLVRSPADCFQGATRVGIDPRLIKANTTINDPKQPRGCFLVVKDNSYTAVYNNATNDGATCGSSTHVKGTAKSLVELTVDLDASNNNTATITMTGPAQVWFGVGFDATTMADLPYTIVVNGTGGVMERRLGDHDPGRVLSPSVTVVSNTVENNLRTVVLTRSMKGQSSDYYTFDIATGTNINFINAYGDTPDFQYHKERTATSLSLLAVDAPTCICDGGATGSINGLKFSKNCLPEPNGDLLQQHNPTCDIRDYQGGLHCCHHQWYLLDADQEIPVEPMTYYMKFRFWYQEYRPDYHQNLIRLYYQTEAWAGEYDVVKCDDSIPHDQCVQEISAHFKVSDMLKDCDVRTGVSCTGKRKNGINLIYVSGHCHAPSCLSMELYNADTGELICEVLPSYGKGTGGRFDELDYVALAPCLFGSADEGLNEPMFLNYDTNLMSIKRNNNTYSHYGEMASWQMRGVHV
eukprot:TRINITY_DN6649_c0_g2_i2.p1 TRINITY_DN6649_c0_g2~~TRINITY_DN6649_c0_g2_i2.p1  ORF type:complete len:719 (+),score=185.41 TRINITY_DN6649_c0_g2_i2:78-2234(+)